MISFRHKGDFSKSKNFLKRAEKVSGLIDLHKYGQLGVAALASATPSGEGTTGDSWYYKVDRRKGSVRIGFYNSHVHDDILIAVILQYGHGTNKGGWVDGRDYINPAIQPIFDKIVYDAWREVTKA